MIIDFPNEILFNESITSTGKLLYTLILHSNKKNETEWSDYTPKQLSTILGMDHLAVVKALKKLEADGWIERREVLSVKKTKKFEYKVKKCKNVC